jgi:hypothetical protein
MWTRLMKKVESKKHFFSLYFIKTKKRFHEELRTDRTQSYCEDAQQAMARWSQLECTVVATRALTNVLRKESTK